MSEPNVAPLDVLNNIEGTRSSSPAQGSGLHLLLNDLSNENIFDGRVDDVFIGAYCAIVSIPGLAKHIPCIWTKAVANRWYGSKEINAPILGTEVKVYLPSDRKLGVILGAVNSPADGKRDRPVGQLAPECGVNSFSDKNAHNPQDWGVLDYLLYAASGMPVDAMPGDWGVINDNNLYVGIQRLVAVLRAGDLAKIEAFALDDVLRITGHNLQEFTGAGERRVTSDLGGVDIEEVAAATQAESLGVSQTPDDIQEDNSQATLRANPTESGLKPKHEQAVGRWRWKRFVGYLGGLVREYVLRPHKNPGSLEEPEKSPDMGLYERSVDTSGFVLERSVTGGGFVKPRAICVPKKRHEADDPAGDVEPPDKPNPKKDFVFKMTDQPGAFEAQMRDFLAWFSNSYQHQRRLERPKDWHVPDEADCPAPGTQGIKPRLGAWTMNLPPEESVMSGSKDFDDETALEGKTFRVGDAWNLITPDGGVSIRGISGAGIEEHGGRLRITAPMGIEIVSGTDVIVLGGDDVVVKAKKSMDLSTTEGQVRIKGQGEVLVTSVEGGLLFATESFGHAFTPGARGESQGLSGIVFKTPGGVLVDASVLNFNISNYVNITGRKDGEHPALCMRTSSVFHWVDTSYCWHTADGYAMIYNGGFFSSAGLQTDGNCFARRNIYSGGEIGGTVVGPADWSEVPFLADLMKPTYLKPDWDERQYPVSLEELSQVKFTFRSSAECATTKAVWFETHWQRELSSELEPWREKELNGTWPWPGEQHYQGSESYFMYVEGNVSEDGRPKKRSEQSERGGTFGGTNFNLFPVHPGR